MQWAEFEPNAFEAIGYGNRRYVVWTDRRAWYVTIDDMEYDWGDTKEFCIEQAESHNKSCKKK